MAAKFPSPSVFFAEDLGCDFCWRPGNGQWGARSNLMGLWIYCIWIYFNIWVIYIYIYIYVIRWLYIIIRTYVCIYLNHSEQILLTRRQMEAWLWSGWFFFFLLLLYIFLVVFLLLWGGWRRWWGWLGWWADDAPLAGLAHQILREDVPVGGNLPLFQEPGALVLELSLPRLPRLRLVIVSSYCEKISHLGWHSHPPPQTKKYTGYLLPVAVLEVPGFMMDCSFHRFWEFRDTLELHEFYASHQKDMCGQKMLDVLHFEGVGFEEYDIHRIWSDDMTKGLFGCDIYSTCAKWGTGNRFDREWCILMY